MTPTAATAALSNHFCIPISTRVPPGSGVILIVRAEESPVRSRKRARFARLENAGGRYLKRLHFVFAVKNTAQFRAELGNVGFNTRIVSTVHLLASFRYKLNFIVRILPS